jgi:hypothetical protein
MIAEVDEFPFCHPHGEFFMPLMHWLVTKGLYYFDDDFVIVTECNFFLSLSLFLFSSLSCI